MEQAYHMSISAGGKTGWAHRLAGWLRRLAGNPASQTMPLRVEARLSLGAKKSLVLVNCSGRQVLLALHGDAITPLLEMPKPRKTAGSSRLAGSEASR
ncbi:MAG TPA: flagellar biosynthetic protein FliO [Acidobacteriaceae bacterium]|jgi:flagellar biogenesis protein FliO|nr:flagellar biosynthetic protein FliO [Acidobacteriaceae bacterium]